MKRNQKINRMFQENHIEHHNYSLVLNLKKTIQQLNTQLDQQKHLIHSYQHSLKYSKFREMEVQVQCLHDENQRLLLLLDQFKAKGKSFCHPSRKVLNHSKKKEDKKQHYITQFKVDSKMGDVLKQNEHLRRQLLSVKVSQSFVKKRKSTLNDRNSILIQKNLMDSQKWQQKQMQTQEQNTKLKQKIQKLEQNMRQLQQKNEQLQRQNYLNYQMNKTVFTIE